MNIIELAREAGFKVDWQHADVAEIKAQRYVAFAAAVIAARDAELIEGVGEPRLYDATDDIEGYTREQVAAAVSRKETEWKTFCSTMSEGFEDVQVDLMKTVKEQKQRIAELESERDMWKATAEAVVDFEKSQMRLRIESLESTLKVALEALKLGESGLPVDAHARKWNVIDQIKEVLHD